METSPPREKRESAPPEGLMRLDRRERVSNRRAELGMVGTTLMRCRRRQMTGDGAAGGVKSSLDEKQNVETKKEKGAALSRICGAPHNNASRKCRVRGRPVTDLRGTAQKCKNV